MAQVNPFRFSTKYQDDETELLNYMLRYYGARAGRWLNRDPLVERGGLNLYGFVGNEPISFIDPLGLNSQIVEGPNGQPIWVGPYSQTPPSMQFGLWWGNGQFIPSGMVWGQDSYGNTVPVFFDPSSDVMGLQPSLLGDILLGGLGTSLRGSAACQASRWGRPGLYAGDWVMPGRPNLWNYARSFKWQPGLGNEFAAPWRGESFVVSPNSLMWPTGWGRDGWIKGFYGQRIYQP
jgi:RHS repeat-associated protein